MFMPSGVVAAARLGNYVITAGQQVSVIGYSRSNYGVLSPDLPFRGNQIEGVTTSTVSGLLQLRLFNANGAPPDSNVSFESLTIDGTFFGGAGSYTLNRSAATYTTSGNEGRWNWTAPDTMLLGNDYDLTLT